MNTQIRCLNPQIILNKSYHVNKVDLLNGWHIILRNREVNYVPSVRKAKIQPDEIDDCYYYNEQTGEMIPLYLKVPCQKCILCRDKKAVDWATRITCETNYHINCPWWITLTYNDICLPEDGILKRELQLFFKRLRDRLIRQYNQDVKIRFVAVGEYGGQFGRPHYHAEVFGMPITSAKEVLRIFEEAWSHRISKERYTDIFRKYPKLASDFTFIRKDKNGKPIYYLRQGFAYVKPAHDNTPLYLAKYMFKPEFNAPDGKNPNFTLSSRKNGIGYKYVVEFRDYHRRNPHVTQVDFVNKHTGKHCHFTIPQYFKDYWFPTPSKIIPNVVKKSYDHFQNILSKYNLIKHLNAREDIPTFDDVDSMISELNKKYPFFSKIKNYTDWDYLDLLKCVFQTDYESTCYDFDMFKRDCIIQLYTILKNDYDYCMSLEFDTNMCMDTLCLRDKYKASCTQKLLHQPPISLIDLAYKLKKRYELAKHKSIY